MFEYFHELLISFIFIYPSQDIDKLFIVERMFSLINFSANENV